MNTRSLRFRMTTWYVGLLAVALLLFGATVYYRLERHLIGQLQESLVEQARTIAEELLVDAQARGDQYVITEINESYDPEVNGRFIRVTYSLIRPRLRPYNRNEKSGRLSHRQGVLLAIR